MAVSVTTTIGIEVETTDTLPSACPSNCASSVVSTAGEERAEDEQHRPSMTASRRWHWLGQVKSWLSVSEPSAQAIKAHRKTAYKRYGIEAKDPRAAAKMHLPIGRVPDGVTTSTTGPSPEKALRDRARENQAKQPPCHDLHETHSVCSRISSSASARGLNQVAPWT